MPEKSSKLQKKKQENEVVQCVFESNVSTFDTKQNEDHVHLALTESTHDSSLNDKNCDWFEPTSLEKRKLCNREIWTPFWFSLIARCKREQ